MLVLLHLVFDLFVESFACDFLELGFFKLYFSEIAYAEITVFLSEDNADVTLFAVCVVCPFLESGDCIALAYGNG